VDIYKILLTNVHKNLSCFGGTLGSGIPAAAGYAFVPHNAIDGLTDLMQFIFASMWPAISTIKSAKAATPPPSLWRAFWNNIFFKVRFSSETGCGVPLWR
jgi:hypothetical protein